MKKPFSTLLFFFLLCVSTAKAQDITINKERNFEGTALYGFMNGGSDLFLEYGFQNLNVKDVTYKGDSYSIEVYTMDTPKDAFGIYSIHIFKPLRADSLLLGRGGFDCLSKYQLQAAFHNRYISIVFNSGPKGAKGGEELLMSTIAAIAAKEGEAAKPFFPEKIQKMQPPYTGRVQYARGELGLTNADEEAVGNYPGIGTEYGLWLYNVSEEDTIIVIEKL